jgi:hypothetical protein
VGRGHITTTWGTEPLHERATVGRFEFNLGAGYPRDHSSIGLSSLFNIKMQAAFGWAYVAPSLWQGGPCHTLRGPCRRDRSQDSAYHHTEHLGSTRYRNQAFTVWVSPWSVWCRTEATVEERSPKDTQCPPKFLLSWIGELHGSQVLTQTSQGSPGFDWPFTHVRSEDQQFAAALVGNSMATSAWNLREDHRIIPWGFY